MASNSFKIKNSLVLTPKDLSTLVSPEAGDLACDINDNNKIKRYDANAAAWVEVGSGGVGGVDILFVQDFESASLSSFTQTGLVLSQTDPLKGKVSAVLNHQAAINQSFKQVIPVDRKFRGESMTLSLDSKSSASQGNLVISIYDETNSSNIVASEQLQLSDEVSGAKSSVTFTIPATCASFSYTITALPESGKVSRIDDIICQLTSVEVINSGLVQEVDSAFRIDGALGYGSTGTTTLRFNTANIRESRGSDISYVSSSVNGDSFVVTSSGVFSISADAVLAGGATMLGITRNSSSTSTSVTTIATNNPQQVLTFSNDIDTNYSNVENVSWSGYLEAGDIIRVQTSGSAIGSAALFRFSMSNQGSLKQVSVSSDQKITIPTSELRFEGASARGTGTESAIVQFGPVAKLRGDAFTVDNSNGTAITMRKAGRLSISCSLQAASASTFQITKNQAVRTGLTTTSSEVLANQAIDAAGNTASCSITTDVQIGDVIRVGHNIAPSASGVNSLNLAFQEQEIAVSVTNVLPQFSESDSSVRVDTANGYGSTATRIRRFSNIRDNIGADIEYLDSATNGASFTVKSAGIYHISYSGSQDGSQQYIGISKNSTQLTTSIVSINVADRLALQYLSGAAGEDANCAWMGYLQAGDVIRPHTDGIVNSTRAAREHFTISKVGKPNVTGVDVTPFVNVPQQDVQEIRSSTLTSTWGSTNTLIPVLNIGTNTSNGVLSVVSSAAAGTKFVALKKCVVNANVTFLENAAGSANGLIYLNEVAIAGSVAAIASNYFTTSASIIMQPGEELTFRRSNTALDSIQFFSLIATATSDSIIAPNESFSTDTASLQYAPSPLYSLTTLANAPVGTYITFTYAANTNTRTQTTVRPTQTDADMNVNGIQVFARAYNATSTAASPAAVAIQIGKGLKGKSLDLYKSTGKVTAGSLDYISFGITDAQGVRYKDYNEQTGILLIDAATQGTSNTSASFTFSDITSQSSGYLVINASKSPALTGVPQLLPRIATLSDVKPSGTAGGTATSGSYQTRTLNTLSDPTGIVTSLASNQFTLPAGEYYIEASAPAFKCGRHKIKLRNITDSTDTILGSGEVTTSVTDVQTRSFISGSITISSSKTFETQHRVEVTRSPDGFGIANGFGDNEVYALVKITKVK